MYSTPAPTWLQILNYLPESNPLDIPTQAMSINGQELVSLKQDYSIPRDNPIST